MSAFIREAWPTIEPATEFIPGWHIDAIAEHLEAVTAGEILRLLINIPPRSMKSISVSIMWPAWEWTFRPWLRWMFASYSSPLAIDHSISRRTVITSEWYQSRWRDAFELTADGVESLRNSHRGAMEATSFSGTALGKGANRLVIDDPHNTKQAESDIERKNTVRDFDRTFSTRLNDKKRDAIVVVMQRLHEEDVSARCIEQGYVHLCLPAEAEGRTVVRFPRSGREIIREDGELLWAEREGHVEIARARLALGDYGYAGQYQQRPAPEAGGMFPQTWPLVEAAPAGGQKVRFWDKAATVGAGCFSVGLLMARYPDGRYVVLDVIRGQWSASQRENTIKQAAQSDGRDVRIYVEQEPGSGGKESAEATIRNLAGYIVGAERVTGDKESRARPLAAQVQGGNVSLVRAAWNKAFIDECKMFPNGRYKDQVDAASGAFNKLLPNTSSRSVVGGQRGEGLRLRR